MTSAVEQASTTPDVSFLVCTFNVAPFVEEAIRSALAQTDVSLEVVVIDDASKDDTANIVERIAQEDPRVRLIRRTENGGISVARNQAIREARGTWMAILDGDDIVLPERSRRMIDIGIANGADVVGDNYERVEEDGTPTASTMIPVEAAPYTFDVDIATFIERNVILEKSKFTLGYLKPIVRSEFMRAQKIFNREDAELRNEDYLLYLDCLLAGAKMVVTSESFYKWRMRRGSNSWRLTTDNFDAMIRANEDMKLAQRFKDNPRIKSMAERYDAAMLRGRQLSLVIDDAKHGKWGNAVKTGVIQPAIWPLIGQYGLEAARKRFGRASN